VVLTVAVSDGTVTIGDVYNGDTRLTKDTNYTVTAATGKVTLKATYLDDLEEGDYTITIKTDQGDMTAVVTVTDTTALETDPATATFDKNTSGAGYVDVAIESTQHHRSNADIRAQRRGYFDAVNTLHR